jgi:hypothetical protein
MGFPLAVALCSVVQPRDIHRADDILRAAPIKTPHARIPKPDRASREAQIIERSVIALQVAFEEMNNLLECRRCPDRKVWRPYSDYPANLRRLTGDLVAVSVQRRAFSDPS